LLAKLNTLSLLGIEAPLVEVEVDVSSSPLPKTMLVGLPEQAIKESIHRVERAIVNSGFLRPNDRVVINLAPAELPKQAASFDLPISLGILAASRQFESDCFSDYAVVGELALEGHTRSIKGALSMAMAARDAGYRGLLLPSENAGEAAVVSDIEVIPIAALSEAVGFFAGTVEIDPHPSKLDELFHEFSRYDLDYGDVRGQEIAKRALTIAAAGAHNIFRLWTVPAFL
jgi:magnesium chelatase family protein